MKTRVVVILAAVVPALACNKGRSLIREAQAQHDAYHIDAAVNILSRVEREAPKTPEVVQARDQAVTWLIEGFDKPDSSHPSRWWLTEALRWNPRSGPAQLRMCKLISESKDYEGLRVCLNDELPKTEGAEGSAVKALRGVLKEHDEQVEREQWLSSSDPVPWRALMDKYPASDEAKVALEKLLRHDSICADLDSYVSGARSELRRQRLVVPDFRKEEKKVAAYFRIEVVAGKRTEEMTALRRAVLAHPILKGEEHEQEALASLFLSLAKTDKLLSEEMDKGVDEGMSALVSWDEEIHENHAFDPQIIMLEGLCSISLGAERGTREQLLAAAAARTTAGATAAPTESGNARSPVLADNHAAGGRYATQACGSILDSTTNLEWFIGPDKDTSWDDAVSWATSLVTCGVGWRVPGIEELKTLYDAQHTAGTGYSRDGQHYPAKLDPAFGAIGGGSWVWSTSTAQGGTQAIAYNFFTNGPAPMARDGTAPGNTPRFTTRAFAVRGTSANAVTDSNCATCTTQEDFDLAATRGRKCCPVTACTQDADCPAGRVCCRIPTGQLCADASRCGGVNRVSGQRSGGAGAR